MYKMSTRWAFCIMCGCVCMRSNENAGDMHSLNYTEPNEIYRLMRGVFSCSWVRCTLSLGCEGCILG